MVEGLSFSYQYIWKRINCCWDDGYWNLLPPSGVARTAPPTLPHCPAPRGLAHRTGVYRSWHEFCIFGSLSVFVVVGLCNLPAKVSSPAPYCLGPGPFACRTIWESFLLSVLVIVMRGQVVSVYVCFRRKLYLGKLLRYLWDGVRLRQSRRERFSGVATNATAPLAKERKQNGSSVNMSSVHTYFSPEVHPRPILPWTAVIIAGLLFHVEVQLISTSVLMVSLTCPSASVTSQRSRLGPGLTPDGRGLQNNIVSKGPGQIGTEGDVDRKSPADLEREVVGPWNISRGLPRPANPIMNSGTAVTIKGVVGQALKAQLMGQSVSEWPKVTSLLVHCLDVFRSLHC